MWAYRFIFKKITSIKLIFKNEIKNECCLSFSNVKSKERRYWKKINRTFLKFWNLKIVKLIIKIIGINIDKIISIIEFSCWKKN